VRTRRTEDGDWQHVGSAGRQRRSAGGAGLEGCQEGGEHPGVGDPGEDAFEGSRDDACSALHARLRAACPQHPDRIALGSATKPANAAVGFNPQISLDL